MKNYRKKQVQPMYEWQEGMVMHGISISDADIENGSPKHGDMIAVNPSDSSDRWLVAKEYFEAYYEACDD